MTKCFVFVFFFALFLPLRHCFCLENEKSSVMRAPTIATMYVRYVSYLNLFWYRQADLYIHPGPIRSFRLSQFLSWTHWFISNQRKTPIRFKSAPKKTHLDFILFYTLNTAQREKEREVTRHVWNISSHCIIYGVQTQSVVDFVD